MGRVQTEALESQSEPAWDVGSGVGINVGLAAPPHAARDKQSAAITAALKNRGTTGAFTPRPNFTVYHATQGPQWSSIGRCQ